MKDWELDIAILVPGMKLSHDILEKQSVGGSETMGIMMAKSLRKQGHNVMLFCNTDTPGPQPDGIVYVPAEQFHSYAATTIHDVTIVQRVPEAFAIPTASKLNLLWQHDLALLRQGDKFKSVLWNVDKVITVSKFMTEQYKEVYGVPDAMFYTSRNGIDLDLIKVVESTTKIKRNRKQLVYASRPERGLDVLLEKIMPQLWERDPEITLVVCGYNNTVPHMVDYYNYINSLIEKHKPRVSWAGHLTKQELYKLYASSGLYVYPTPSPQSSNFAEVSFIGGMECMSLGLPIITSNKGALPETIHPEAGVFIDGDPWIETYQWQFVSEVLRVLYDDVAWERMSRAGRKKAQELSIDELTRQWTEEFKRLITQRNDNPIRLAHHFIRHSDVFAAEKVLTGVEGEQADYLRDWLEEDWGFRHNSKKLEEHYRDMGEVTDERLSNSQFTEEHFNHSDEKRFALIEECLKADTSIEKILDVGTGHGWMTVYLERRVGRKWVGIDIDVGAIKWSNKFKQFAKNPENLTFIQGTHTVNLEEYGEFDCLLMSEVLEHCMDPVETLQSMERWVKPGGTVIITVPYGPREYPDFDRIEHRNHLWELDFHSLRDMLSGKPKIEILSVYEKTIEETGEPAGFYFIRYKADHKLLGKINWDRKLRFQRPRQTVSGSMICGPNAEDTLKWCLKSIEGVVDELVVADCGMSDKAIEIANEYGAKIVSGVDPKVDGFDTARNLTLPNLTGDWVLWIDSDEKLIDKERIYKYLRENMFHGYSIRQHHFAVDTQFKPDMPVRLFRNRHYNGKPLQWWGSCHEHPETGINEGPGVTIVLSDVHIAHMGYLIESGRRRKFWRNNPLLEKSYKQYPDRLLNKHFKMRDNMLLCTYELQGNGGVITPNVKIRCEEVMDIYRKHFLGKGNYLNADALDYYSQACTILGLGAEVVFCVNASKDGPPSPQIKTVRFASEEDLQVEMQWRVKEAMSQYCNKWW